MQFGDQTADIEGGKDRPFGRGRDRSSLRIQVGGSLIARERERDVFQLEIETFFCVDLKNADFVISKVWAVAHVILLILLGSFGK